jgi:hypothetical protein
VSYLKRGNQTHEKHDVTFVLCVGLWSFVFHVKAGHRLRILDNTVLRRIFGSTRQSVAGYRRKLHIDKLHNQQTWFSLNINSIIISRKMGCTLNIARMGDKRNAHKGLSSKPGGKRTHERPRSGGKTLLIILEETGWEVVDWIYLV